MTRNVQAVEDMLHYFYLNSYKNIYISQDTSIIQQLKLLVTHHTAVYKLACNDEEGYRALAVTGFACAQFYNTTTGALEMLSRPVHSTAENAVQLLSLLVDVIYNDQTCWNTTEEDDGPHISGWPLGNWVYAAAVRIWQEAQG